MIADARRGRRAELAHLLDRRLDLLQRRDRRSADGLLALRALDQDRGRTGEAERIRLSGSLLDHGIELRGVAIRVPLADVGNSRALRDPGEEGVGHVARVLPALVEIEELE